jgi:hypothetical protein
MNQTDKFSSHTFTQGTIKTAETGETFVKTGKDFFSQTGDVYVKTSFGYINTSTGINTTLGENNEN